MNTDILKGKVLLWEIVLYDVEHLDADSLAYLLNGISQ